MRRQVLGSTSGTPLGAIDTLRVPPQLLSPYLDVKSSQNLASLNIAFYLLEAGL